jgi:hypothetical protein
MATVTLPNDWTAYEYMLRYLPGAPLDNKENEPPTLNKNGAVVFSRNRSYAHTQPAPNRGVLAEHSVSDNNSDAISDSRYQVISPTSEDDSVPELVGRHRSESSSSEDSLTDSDNEATPAFGRHSTRLYALDEPTRISVVTYTTWDVYMRNLRNRTVHAHVHALRWDEPLEQID